VGLKSVDSQQMRLSLEQIHAKDLWVAFQAPALARLAISDSTFERNFHVFYRWSPNYNQVTLTRSRFIDNDYAVTLVGKTIKIVDNFITDDPRSFRPEYSIGILLGLTEGGEAEISGNTLSFLAKGMHVGPQGNHSTLYIRRNQFFANQTHLSIDSSEHPHDKWVEDNIFADGGVGIVIDRMGSAGGIIRLHRNKIALQRQKPLLLNTLRAGKSVGEGIGVLVLGWLQPWKELLTIELVANRIVQSENWGIALNPWIGPQRDDCVVGEDIPPGTIQGHDNEFENNAKGHLCPADYPWPPGFVKP
jgi:hypothetical protein